MRTPMSTCRSMHVTGSGSCIMWHSRSLASSIWLHHCLVTAWSRSQYRCEEEIRVLVEETSAWAKWVDLCWVATAELQEAANQPASTASEALVNASAAKKKD